MPEAISPPSRRRRVWLWIGAFVLVPVLVAALVVVVARRTGPQELPPTPLQVRLEAPATTMVGSTVRVLVAAVAPDPITRIEVWADNDLVAAEESAEAATAILTELPWPVAHASTTSLVARAFDALGRVGLSNTVVVAVNPGIVVHLVDEASVGATLTELAGGASVVSELNPGIEPTAPLGAGTPVLLPVIELDGPPANAPPARAQTLELKATAAGCGVSAVVTGLTDPADRPAGWSVELHRHLVGAGGSLVAGVVTGASDQASFTDTPGAGTHLYSAIERSGATMVTPLVSVAVDGCPARDALTLDQGVLKLGSPVDGVFLYVSHGGASYRVPPDPAELITGDGSTFDLRPFLPLRPMSEVVVEIWSRRGATVRRLGTQVLGPQAILSPQTSLHGLWKAPFLPEPVPTTQLAALSNGSAEFAWSSTVAHSGVRWFLARTKPGPATVLSPVGVVQTGTTNVDGSDGRFSIDLRSNEVPSVVPLTLDKVGDAMAFADLPVAGGGPSRSLPVHVDAPGTTWVWAIPIGAAGNPVGPPSNVVKLVIKPAPYDPTIAPPYDVVDVKVTIPPAPNPALRGCVRIVSETPGFPIFLNGLGVYLDGKLVPAGGSTVKNALPYTLENWLAVYPFTACPGEQKTYEFGGGADGDFLGDIGITIADGLTSGAEFVVDIVNWASETYQELKHSVISAVADVLCPSQVHSECETLITVAVDVMLTSVGIPPSLPNFGELANAAKGELVNLALDQLGVSEACDAVATSATGKTCGEVAVALSEQDACALAPQGKQQQCQNYVAGAALLCSSLTDHAACELATANARDLVEAGMGEAYDLAVQMSQDQVTAAMYGALTGMPASYYLSAKHGCAWGGPQGTTVICPQPGLFEPLPTGCNYANSYGKDTVVCTKPPPVRVATPEPRGHQQPIRVDVAIQRNGKRLPEDFHCGPISAIATTITPTGAVGQPYLAAASMTDITYDHSFDAGWVQQQHFTLWLHEPNPFVEIEPDKLPVKPGWINDVEEFVNDMFPGAANSSLWQELLVPGSLVGVKVWGDCIGEVNAGKDSLGVVGVVGPPLPRIKAGEL